jgi:uncharacterized protein DUF4124
MKLFLLSLGMVALAGMPVLAATYEWKDDAGVIHFTDNPESIPAKYRNRVEEREPVNVESSAPSAAPSPQPAPAAGEAPQARPELYGGHDLSWWRSRYASLKKQQEQLRKEIEDRREKLNQLHRKRLVFQRASDRSAYNQAKEELERKEAALLELGKKLADLEEEAARGGVPARWREEQ